MRQALTEGYSPYRGRSLGSVQTGTEKSAEACPVAKHIGVIVVKATSRYREDKNGGLTLAKD